jgi:hypothetical protein
MTQKRTWRNTWSHMCTHPGRSGGVAIAIGQQQWQLKYCCALQQAMIIVDNIIVDYIMHINCMQLAVAVLHCCDRCCYLVSLLLNFTALPSPKVHTEPQKLDQLHCYLYHCCCSCCCHLQQSALQATATVSLGFVYTLLHTRTTL